MKQLSTYLHELTGVLHRWVSCWT